ncbi:hypothetical protein U1Q18_001007 [Sarracenia purpurea var. burkii]
MLNNVLSFLLAEENFFGPVSTSFIRPGRLSDSAASDENHDITMDSTAFSLHFRSLARSEAGGDLKTPTGVHLSFEEKTPTKNTLPTNERNSMLVTVVKKPTSVSSTSVDNLSGSIYSADMSLVGENPKKYDYERLSPGLNALLAEGRKDLHTVLGSDNITISKSTISKKSWFSPSKKHSGPMEPNDGGEKEMIAARDKEMIAIDSPTFPAEALSFAHKQLDEANGGYNFSPLRQIKYGNSSDLHNAPASDVSSDKKNWSRSQLTKGLVSGKSKESDALETRTTNLDFDTVHRGTPSNLDKKIQQIDVFAPSECDSPLAGSMSSVSVKQCRIVSDIASPSQNLQITTPSRKQPGSLVGDETITHNVVSSIQKSISKLEMLEASPLSTTLKISIDSIRMPSELPLCADASVSCSEDQLFIVPQENGKRKYMANMDGIGIEILENIVDLSHAKDSLGVAKVGISPGSMSSGDLRRDLPIELMEAEEGLLSQISWSGNKTQKNLLTPGDPTEEMVVTYGTGSTAEITLDHLKDKRSTGSPHGIIPSSEKSMERRSLASKVYWGSISRDLSLYNRDNTVKSIDPEYDADSGENVRNSGLLTTVTNKLDSLFMERAKSSSPIIEINHAKESNGTETMDGSEIINIHALQDESGAIGEFQTSLTDKETKKFKWIGLDGNLQIDTDPVMFKDLTVEGVKATSYGSSSPFIHKSDNEPPHQKQVGGLFTCSPSRKEHPNAIHNDRLHFPVEDVLEDVPSLNTSQLMNSFEIFSGQKRRWEDVIPRDSVLLDEMAGNLRSPKHHRTGSCSSDSISEQPNERNPETSRVREVTRLEHWADIGVLEDVLVNLRRLQMYEMLCTEIQSQKKVQQLSSRIQECRVLKLNSLPRLSLPSPRDAHADNSHCQSVDFVGSQEDEGAGDKVTALRQVLDSLERKVMSLTKSFHTSCKMKGEPNYADTTSLVNDHLKKKACCRFIRLELQLWDVDKLETMSDHHNIVLNYLGFIIQSFTINVGPVSSIVISNKLNDVNILKNFPNMDVCTAFAFALNANTPQMYVGSRSLTRETQITSSVLGNLLDVVEEVQVACVELQNLTYTNFCSPSVERLELHLHFINFKSGRKVALIIDMSCLKWGVYPSEVIPSQFEGPLNVSGKLTPDPHTTEITAAVRGLRFGYLRIIRLCKCVSQVVQSWSG